MLSSGRGRITEAGYSKPLHMISANDKKRILTSLCDFHLFMKVKAVMDQFKDGLALASVLPFLKSNFDLRSLVVDETCPGMLRFILEPLTR